MAIINAGHVPEQCVSPPCLPAEEYDEAVRRSDQYKKVLAALDSLNDLEGLLDDIDNLDPEFKPTDPISTSLFCGYRGGKYPDFNVYEALALTKIDLEWVQGNLEDQGEHQ